MPLYPHHLVISDVCLCSFFSVHLYAGFGFVVFSSVHLYTGFGFVVISSVHLYAGFGFVQEE